MFVRDHDLREIERGIKGGNGSQQEELARVWIQVVVDGPHQRFARDDDLGIPAIAYFKGYRFGTWQHVAVRKKEKTQPTTGKDVARERGVGAGAGDGDK